LAIALVCTSALLLGWSSGGCRVKSGGVSAPAPNPGSDAGTSSAPKDIATEYDLIYAITHASANPNPSPFLVSTVSGAGKPVAGATALDIGCGAGRNAL